MGQEITSITSFHHTGSSILYSDAPEESMLPCLGWSRRHPIGWVYSDAPEIEYAAMPLLQSSILSSSKVFRLSSIPIRFNSRFNLSSALDPCFLSDLVAS